MRNRYISTVLVLFCLAACGKGFWSFRSPRSIRQLEQLPTVVFQPTGEVEREIRHFTKVDRRFITDGLKRRQNYNTELSRIFRAHGVPVELVNLAHVESIYRPKAKSSAGAVGLWQFMKPTAKQYGLKVGFFMDERTNPYLSTIAAARYLRDLYQQFGDWQLVLAAYNAGPGRIRKALRKCQCGKDFWRLSRDGYINGETKKFVPRTIAVAMISERPDRYGFKGTL